MRSVSLRAVGVCLLAYALVGVAGYVDNPASRHANLLLNYNVNPHPNPSPNPHPNPNPSPTPNPSPNPDPNPNPNPNPSPSPSPSPSPDQVADEASARPMIPAYLAITITG